MKDILDIFDKIIQDPHPFRHMSDDEKSDLCSQMTDIRNLLEET